MSNTLAKLYDWKSQLIAHCINTPEAIAKAAMEHPEVSHYIGAPQRTRMRGIGAVRPLMNDANKAESGYVPVPGVVPSVYDDNLLDEIIDR